jgi:hypothetical protein
MPEEQIEEVRRQLEERGCAEELGARRKSLLNAVGNYSFTSPSERRFVERVVSSLDPQHFSSRNSFNKEVVRRAGSAKRLAEKSGDRADSERLNGRLEFEDGLYKLLLREANKLNWPRI